MKMPLSIQKKARKAQMKLIAYSAGTIFIEKALNQKKLLVGSSEHADIRIENAKISHYHAFLLIDDNGATLIDLASENGCYINGERSDKAFFSIGDTVSFGDIEFHVQDLHDSESSPVIDHDIHCEKIDENLLREKQPELPPLPGLVVIDGEYCDIVFDDEQFKPLETLPLNTLDLNLSSYINPEDKDEEVVPIARVSKAKALEVIVMTNGVILSVDYFSSQKAQAYASPVHHTKKAIHVPALEGVDNIPFLTASKGVVTIKGLPGFTCSNLKDKIQLPIGSGQSYTFKPQDILSFNLGTLQIMIREVDSPASLRLAPFFGRERAAKVQMTKVFSALMSFALLLLLVDLSVDPPEKEIAIIYREAIKAPEPSTEKASEEVAKIDTDTGVKQTEQSEEAPRMAKQAQPTPKPAQSKPQPAQPTPPTPEVAQAQPAASQPVQAEVQTETKTYQFQMRSQMANLINNDRPNPTEVQNPSRAVAAVQGFQAKANAQAGDLAADTSGAIGSLGQDFAGDYDSSAGTKGLASKKGIDTTYIDPKTVVLGSMDPELLRRILQEYLPQFRHCYQQELERQGDLLQGVVDMNFRIEPDGKVSRVNIRTKNAAFSERGVQCMSGVLRIIDFPKPKGGGVVDVRQPLNFSSSRARL
jgi:outer membrane biosynthesis protein TonB